MTANEAIKSIASEYVPVIYRRIAAALESECALDVIGLCKIVHCEKFTARTALNKMHEMGIARIIDYRKSGRIWVPIWALGKGKHKPMPEPKTRKQIEEDRRARVRVAAIPLTMAGMLRGISAPGIG